MGVVVNNVELSAADEARIAQQVGCRFPQGRFWYDRASGLWGLDGKPAMGFTRAGLDVGGPLPEDATVKPGGFLSFITRSRIYLNGRELAQSEAQWLAQALLQGGVVMWRGRYFLDAQGDLGKEGGKKLTNLPQLIQMIQVRGLLQQAFGGGSGGGGQGYTRSTAGGYIGSDGQTSYFFDPQSGSSVMTGG